jgi:peptide/nickel transport system permease protein
MAEQTTTSTGLNQGAPPVVQVLPETATRRKERSLWRDAWHKLIANRLALISIFIMGLIFFVGIFGPLIAPYDYLRQDLSNMAATPSWAHPLGTDELGRDMLSRILWGGRTAILVASIVTSMSFVMGVSFGAAAAYLGARADFIFSRVVDLLQTFPGLLLAVLLAATLKPAFDGLGQSLAQSYGLDPSESTVYLDYFVVFGALSVVGWYGIARLIRGQILSLRATDYVTAARSVGVPERRIIFRHLVPNAIGPVIVSLSASFGGAMLAESSLSYLGMGIQPPGASWGAMIRTSMQQWRYHPHLALMPGFVLFLAVLSANFIGDGLNDALNPRTLRT